MGRATERGWCAEEEVRILSIVYGTALVDTINAVCTSTRGTESYQMDNGDEMPGVDARMSVGEVGHREEKDGDGDETETDDDMYEKRMKKRAKTDGYEDVVKYIPSWDHIMCEELRDPESVDVVAAKIAEMKPTVLVVHGGVEKHDSNTYLRALPKECMDRQNEIIAAMTAKLSLVYLDAWGTLEFGEKVRKKLSTTVLAYDGKNRPDSCVAYEFLQGFLATLQIPHIGMEEAYAVSAELACMYNLTKAEEGVGAPPIPRFLGSDQPHLPGIKLDATVDKGEHTNGSGPVAEPAGFSDVRLCAAQAEVRMLVAGFYDLIAVLRLGSFCQALRGIIAAEVGKCSLVSKRSAKISPKYLKPKAEAYVCKIQTASGVEFSALVGAPADIARDDSVLERAVRQALVADTHSFQLKLPPPGAPLPKLCHANAVAHGTPHVEALGVTSTWVVQVLKSLILKSSYTPLAVAGLCAIGSSINPLFTKVHALRMTTIACGGDMARGWHSLQQQKQQKHQLTADQLLGPKASQLVVKDSEGEKFVTKATKEKKIQQTKPMESGIAGSSTQQRRNPNQHEEREGNKPIGTRKALEGCSNDDFKADIAQFLSMMKGVETKPSDIPDMSVLGNTIPLLHAYKHVCRLGGFAAVSTEQWGSEVLPQEIRNKFSKGIPRSLAENLKYQYRHVLLDYETGHPDDVAI